MTSSFGPRRVTPWLTALFGAALLLAAGLIIALLSIIGWTAWHRASLSDQWQRIRDEDRARAISSVDEASQLRTGIGATHDRIALARQELPGDADVAGYVANLRTEAALMGVAVTEIIPQPTSPSPVPVRRFTIRAQGLWPQLLGFVAAVSRAPLSTARLESVTISSGDAIDTLSFDLIVTVRPPEPLSEAAPRRHALALAPLRQWQE